MVNENFRATRVILLAIGIMSIPLSAGAAEQGRSTATLSVSATVIRPLQVMQQSSSAGTYDLKILNAESANVRVTQCAGANDPNCPSKGGSDTWVTVQY